MVIYTVRQGDTLWSLARRYGTTVDNIVRANGIQGIQSLVVGQALVIPSEDRTHVVQPGDTLYTISRRFNVSVQSIVRANNITNPNALTVGTTLLIPGKEKNFGYIEVNAYIEPEAGEANRAVIREVGTYLTYLTPFSYYVNEDGSLTPIEDQIILEEARPFRVAPLMAIANFRNGTFDTELASAILSSVAVQRTLINNIIATMRSKGYYGLNIDFERISPDEREAYNNFLRRVVAALRPLNYPVSTALAPKTSGVQTGAWYGAHDYPAHGQIVDFVILMTYEWGWSGGPPLPVAPINQVRAVLNYALSVMPREKIMMGMPLYGYDWTLPYTPGGRFARRISNPQAIRLAARYGAAIQYDQEAQSPFFYYTDDNGARHIVWFEDARSVQAKLMMASELGLRGVSYWVLGVPFRQNWEVLDNMFQIVKVVR